VRVGIPDEIHQGEERVAAPPGIVERLVARGFECLVESGAGSGADASDDAYRKAGASIAGSPDELWEEADLILKVRPPEHDPERDRHEVELLGEGDLLVCLLWPDQNEELVERIAEQGVTAFALDAVPRLTRAQSMDVLSSMAGIAGYRAVIEAANRFGRFFSAQMTAAGSTPPAKVLVIGAGVAGLQAVATADDMGAVVHAFDTREAVQEEVESLGGQFLEFEFDASGEADDGYAKEMSEAFIEAERELFTEQAAETDIVITTASVPGEPAPELVMDEALEHLPDGAVVVDLAAEQGGNCTRTEPGEVVEYDGVEIVGVTNLTSRLAAHASHYFGRNIANFLELFGEADAFEIDEEDRVVREMLVVRDGDVRWPPPEFEEENDADDAGTLEPVEEPAELEAPAEGTSGRDRRPLSAGNAAVIVGAAALMFLVGQFAPSGFVEQFMTFVLACVIGWQVVWNVASSLHTPLMSVTNAVSGIIIVGGLYQATAGASFAVQFLAGIAVLVASINIFGGFLVTRRMLRMFRADDEGGT